MQKAPSYLKVDPDKEIAFSYIPRKCLYSTFQITNIQDHPVCYKIKTNVPASYLVKPHFGTLPAGSSQEIQITMQPTDYNPQNASINDKFLINAIPLSSNQDLSALEESSQFQKIWDGTPKQLVQGEKLKVVLKFESSVSRSSTNVKRPEGLESIKESDKESLSESRDLGTSGAYQSYRDPNSALREEMGTSMLSAISNSGQEQVADKSKDVGMAESQEVIIRKEDQGREKEKRRSEVPTSTPTDENSRLLEEKIGLLEKKVDELTAEKKTLNQRHQELLGKGEEQKRLLFELAEENNRLKSELSNLKSSTFQEKSPQGAGQNANAAYELWHLLGVAIIAMIIGAFLSSS